MKKKKTMLLTTLCVLLGVTIALAQRTDTGAVFGKTIRGTVFDDVTGEVLPFVAVAVKGTTRGTLTGIDGAFSIPVQSEGSVLVFSLIGYENLELRADPKAAMSVRLKPSAIALDAVVVTGMFDRPKESYTGAVTAVKAEELQTRRGQNLVQTLRNIDPAINMLENNLAGSNPNALPNITIRGRSSLPVDVQALNEGQRYNLNMPLIIMDGFEISLQKLMDYNDDEIESINILKDASSTAIYGSRGANGVIVIISKQPVPGQLRINFKTSVDMDIPDLTSYDLLNAKEKLQLEWDNGFYNSTDPDSDLRLKQLYNQRLRDVLEGADTYWLSKPLRTGITYKNNLRLEGGSEEFRWSAVVAHGRENGVMKDSYRDNFSGQLTLQYNYKNIVFRNQTEIGINKGVNSKYGAFSNYTTMNPYYKIYDDNGMPIQNFTGIDGKATVSNPLYDASLNNVDQSGYKQTINNFSIEWTIIEGLMLRGKLGLSMETDVTEKFVSPLHSTYMSNTYYTQGDGVLERGRYTYMPGEAGNYDGNITLSYAKTFEDKHQLYVGLDYSILQRKSITYAFDVVGFNNDELNTIGSAMRYPTGEKATEAESFTRSLGITSNINYMYDNRYYADLSFRVDGSSQFGANNRFAPFYSVGLGWNLHREGFLKDSEVVNNLRLKVSYGETGSQQFSAYQAMQVFKYYLNDRYGNWGAAYLNSFGNKDLKWQVTSQLNVGTEAGLFNNRVTAQFDYYVKKTSNLLSNIDIPLATGFGNYIANVGEVQNIGFEAALGGAIIRDQARRILWTVNAKIAYNKDKITKLSEDIKRQTEEYLLQDVDVSTLFYEGHSQNALYVVRSLGIDPSTGQEVFLDKNDNVVYKWAPSDKVYAGVQEPTYRGNISTMLRYKNLSFNLSFAYHWGGVVYNSTLLNRVELLRTAIPDRNVDRRVFTNRWSRPGDIAAFKKIPTADETDIRTRGTTRFVMDDQVFQLQTASVEYRLETDWLKKARIQNAKISLNMSDLFYISSVKRERGLEYPFARRIGASLSLTF
ncbi:MAG: SusC/RagA family TonB-linked outer membrane protein [Prevotellaceae bacterium]|jgi:TonB-linked SusC/RagA family outer membrane protein|nr:SusC/RagA family TonB-linked outer membrane protein [Prevotellaceae bacterium]